MGADTAIDSEHGDPTLGREAARLLWHDLPETERIHDPRTLEFASAMVRELATLLANSPGVVKKIMSGAAAAAEDLNVGQFQGLVEVIQNADDIGASEVKFALREGPLGRQLLVVHDGLPVTCQHVLAMALPFLTTKTNRPDQRGRFGIGLKTLTRIATSMAVHSAPYHFLIDQGSLREAPLEAALAEFYDPLLNTLLVLNLRSSFDEAALKAWFDLWEDDGLLFLNSVGRFRWCTTEGETISERKLTFGEWQKTAFRSHHDDVSTMMQRSVESGANSWIVWRAVVAVPAHLHPAHKQRSDTTDISVAIADRDSHGSIYAGFKTRIPVELPVAIDAPFDPSTAREQLIENEWNSWLIDRCADVIADVAAGLLIARPENAWVMIPTDNEHVGTEADHWLRDKFELAFGRLRSELGDWGAVSIGTDLVLLKDIAYEEETLTGLVAVPDTEALAPGKRALSPSVRDSQGRWRRVLDLLGVSTTIGTDDLLRGFDDALFAPKEPTWWVRAARCLTLHHTEIDELFGRRFWLAEDGRALACYPRGQTAQQLLLGTATSNFALRWKLLERLHPAYEAKQYRKDIAEWLTDNAAFTIHIDAKAELSAFAERFAEAPVEIQDTELREIRDKFNDLSEQEAGELGPLVGAGLLLDGYAFKGGRQQPKKVSPTTAYLSRTLDGDHPHWPEAAGKLPGIDWISARYEDQLRTGQVRQPGQSGKKPIVRGPRKFLLLLGTEVAPRLMRLPRVAWGSPARVKHLIAEGAEQVSYDYASPDLQKVLKSLSVCSKKEAKKRSPELLRALSRNWQRLYQDMQTVPSQHVARVYTYEKGSVPAAWLNELCESSWIAVGRGELVPPSSAVIKTNETLTLYGTFVAGVEANEIAPGLASALGLIVDVRVSDLLAHLKEIRDVGEPGDPDHIMNVYRNISRRCPRDASWSSHVGDVSVQELRRAFSDGPGLIYSRDGVWCHPSQLFRGKDIFHDRSRIVPGGVTCENLWLSLGVLEPSLDDCVAACRALALRELDVGVTAILIDLYRYMEPLLASAARRQKQRLKELPVVCYGTWTTERPVFLVESHVREQLANALPGRRFWTPPCDTRELPNLVKALGISPSEPDLLVASDRLVALDRGDALRPRFEQAIGHLSDELARNDLATREKLSIGWDKLATVPLYVYDDAFLVQANDMQLADGPVMLRLNALVETEALAFHVCDEALGDRESGGRAIASFFPAEVRRKIDGEWALAWQKSIAKAPEAMRLASDEEIKAALEERAAKINAAPKSKIKVSVPASRLSPPLTRTLKTSVGQIGSATVNSGSTATPTPSRGSAGLIKSPPEASTPSTGDAQSGPIAYTNAELEQRGWELLRHALNTCEDGTLVDFRRRHGVGADGAIDWTAFVELKATGRGPQSSVEMSNSEYERAKERGGDFILALVSGLENGQKDEIRLIIDPVRCVSVRPMNGVRLTGLLEAPFVLIPFEEVDEESV